MESQPATQDLHKVCGTLEVARDLVGRSGFKYLESATIPDSRTLECFAHAASALARVIEVLEGQITEPSLGPAA